MVAANTEWISRRGLSPGFALGIVVVTIMLVFAVAYSVWVQSSGRPVLPLITDLELFGILIIIGTIYLIALWTRSPRKIGLAQSGVILVYPFSRTTLPWDELLVVKFLTDKVLVFRKLHSNPNGLWDWYEVPLNLARRILSDPRCPPVQIPDAQRRLIFQTHG